MQLEGLITLERRTFASFSVRNYRLYFAGQAVSLCGTWMQGVAQSWLVLQLTGSGTAIGTVIALQFLPMLILPAWLGVFVDRVPKRRILYVTQGMSALLAMLLGFLVLSGSVRLWEVYALAVALGTVGALDNPARQAFLSEIVGSDHIANAVALNSTEVSLARVIGPVVAAFSISAFGLAACFMANGVSFLAVIAVVALMRPGELKPAPLTRPRPGLLLQGLRYAWVTPVVRTVLLMMAVIGTLSLEFTVIVPLLAKETFAGDVSTYAALMSWLGGGAVLASLYVAGQEEAPLRTVSASALFLGLSMLLMADAPTLWVALVAALAVGFFSTVFASMANIALQLRCKPALKGRVLALWTVAFLGSSVIGGPAIGWCGEVFGPRWGLAVGGLAAIAVSAYGYRRALRK